LHPRRSSCNEVSRYYRQNACHDQGCKREETNHKILLNALYVLLAARGYGHEGF